MKKLKYLLVMLLLVPVTGKAAINCSTPGTVESGETFGVTFYGSVVGNAPIWFGKLASDGNVSYSSGDLTIAGEETNNFSRTVYFTAGNPGDASFYAYDVDVASDSESFDNSNRCYVEITSATRPNGSEYSANIYDGVYDDEDLNLSSNNFLKSLEVSNYKISPTFKKETLDYSLIVGGDVEKVSLKAELEDENADLSYPSEVELKEGINKVEIVVIAENGETKKYVINITRKEKNPLEVTINKKKYTVFKKETSLKIPEGFTKTTITIDKQEVVAYKNKFSNYILVTLVDTEGNASWFIYDQNNGSYTKYSELKSDNIRLVILKPDKKDIPHRYKSIIFNIGTEEVNGYMLEYESPFRLVYALNMNTGEKSFYLYDINEKTFQRFYNTQVNIYRELVKKLEVIIICLLSVILILLIVIICQMIMKRKIKKYMIHPKEKIEKSEDLEIVVKEEEPIKTEEIINEPEIKEKKKKNKKVMTEETNTDIIEEKIDKVIENKENVEETIKLDVVDEYQDQEPLSKKELKRKLKEEKKQLRKERKEFLD